MNTDDPLSGTLTPENIDAIIQEGYRLINAGWGVGAVIENQTAKLKLLLINEPDFFAKAPEYHLAVARLERSLEL